jgi:hypothetical protein
MVRERVELLVLEVVVMRLLVVMSRLYSHTNKRHQQVQLSCMKQESRSKDTHKVVKRRIPFGPCGHCVLSGGRIYINFSLFRQPTLIVATAPSLLWVHKNKSQRRNYNQVKMVSNRRRNKQYFRKKLTRTRGVQIRSCSGGHSVG